MSHDLRVLLSPQGQQQPAKEQERTLAFYPWEVISKWKAGVQAAFRSRGRPTHGQNSKPEHGPNSTLDQETN